MSSKNAKKKFNDNNFINETENEYESWFANGLHRFIIVFSVMWFGIVAVYITKFFGWDNLFSMVPNEFSGFMAGITLPLAIVWVIMAYIDRGSSFKNETRMLRDSLNQVIFPDSNGSEATKMIADAIKAQVADLKEATRDVCAQSDVIKRDLTDRVAELKDLAEALDRYSSQTMTELNEEVGKLVENFNAIADKASSATADFRVNTLQMREDSEKLVSIVTPMVNEMVTAAERVKEVVNVNNENIARAQEQLNQYSDSSQSSIARMIETWEEKGENLQKTFLRTSENCEELFRRLDSGISHIENSIKEQKQVVETQSGLIDKNSAFLDNKLGEYGRLISLEVEAMVERSGTLEQNIQTQIRNMRETSEQISAAFGQLGDKVVEKRKLLENEGIQIVNNINKVVTSFGDEAKRLQEFYGTAQNKNNEFGQVVSSVTQSLNAAEENMNKNIEAFGQRAMGILDKFSEINKQVNNNILRLTESSDQMSEQSKATAGLLAEQDVSVSNSVNNLKQIAAGIVAANKKLAQVGVDMGDTLQKYENKMNNFGKIVDEHLASLRDGYEKTEKQVDEFNQKFKSASIDTFMRDSSDIISELEAISIDINAVFNKASKDDELWKKYYEGDHGAFVRYLSKNMTKKQVASVKDDYESNQSFRVLVDKYLSDFEALVMSARQNERAGTLLALISGSDIGKVYYILARALGKLN
ncbi:MAG: hypothetical protein IJ532_05670 [Alphaproteobacteria bacterium]|nr:hypothetical protein [Alphaproteobacteria bacterium]